MHFARFRNEPVGRELLFENESGSAADAARKEVGVLSGGVLLQAGQVGESLITMRTRSEPLSAMLIGAVGSALSSGHVAVLLSRSVPDD